MKVICVGFWKTGTKSLARALRILGYKVYDYDDQLFELIDLWEKFFDGTLTDEEIRKSLEDVDVLIDGPVIAFWEHIHRAIPDAKVILTTRQDEDSWYRSFKGMQVQTPVYLKVLFSSLYLTPHGRRFMSMGVRFASYILGLERFPLIFFSDNPRLYKYKYRQHNNHVIKTMEGKEFLIHKPGDGWEPLCKFLGKEVPPDTPYPHMNKDGSHFVKEGGPQNKNFKKAMGEALVVLVLGSCLVLYILYLFLSSFL